MQHYTTNDQMLTVHADKIPTAWQLVDAITPADARGVFDFTLAKMPCYDVGGREIPGLYHIERMARACGIMFANAQQKTKRGIHAQR